MGQQISKDEIVYQRVIEGNVDAIKALCNEGARLEWFDKEGKTPLIVACMDPRLYTVAKTLIELGANINSYRPGRHAGTPLHHASKRGLDHTVKLLLSLGANPYIRNDDCQTPLDVARTKGYCNVVRAIEDHISHFSGVIHEIHNVSGILESLVPQRLSRKMSKKSWVVVVPCTPPNPNKPQKLELAVYNSQQDYQPRSIISLWKCHIAEPKFHDAEPVLEIVDQSSGTRHKFLSTEGDWRPLVQLYSACQGVPKVVLSSWPSHTGSSGCSNEADAEAVELATAINLSIQSAGNSHPGVPSASSSQSSLLTDATNGWGDIASSTTDNGWGPTSKPPSSKASCSGWADQPVTEEYNGWASPDTTLLIPSQPQNTGNKNFSVLAPTVSAPSAPPIPGDISNDLAIHYPAIDSSPVDVPFPTAQHEASASSATNGKGAESSCVICWETPVEGVCIPCGHMAGCMSCLTEIKSKKGDCPVCRAKIDQVIKVYAVWKKETCQFLLV